MPSILLPWALAGGTAVTVVFARFGYALILPAMEVSLGLNYTQAGELNITNVLGCLLGSFLIFFMPSILLPLALAGGTAVTVGFARFGYALILPAMQDSLGLNYTQAGWLNTTNALGYLLGSFLTVLLVNRLGNHRLFVAGLLLTTVAL